MKTLIDHIFRMLIIIIAAFYIKVAIESFMCGLYFIFGLLIMCAIYMSAYLVKSVFYDVLK